MVFPEAARGAFENNAARRPPFDPELPSSLSPASIEPLTGSIVLEGCRIQGILCPNAALGESEVAGCVFSECSFAHAELSNSLFTDTVFEDCDLSNAILDRSGFTRCRFTRCKMTGLSFEDGMGSDLAYENCSCAYSSFHRTHLKVFSLTRCDLTEADMSGMELQQGTLSDTRFSATNLFRTSLAGLDFSECLLESVVLSDNSE